MPHIQIDYSPNLADRLDIAGLCVVLRDAAVATGVLPLAGIRVRATACTHVVIADAPPTTPFWDTGQAWRFMSKAAPPGSRIIADFGAFGHVLVNF